MITFWSRLQENPKVITCCRKDLQFPRITSRAAEEYLYVPTWIISAQSSRLSIVEGEEIQYRSTYQT
jgi:hypothetical protein